MYVNEIIQQQCSIETNAYEKQSSKVWKVVTPTFFNNIITHSKLNEKFKKFIDDLVLVVVKGLFFLNTIENIRMKQFGLRRDPQLVLHHVEL
jgi:hypothetical protein